MFNIFSPKTNTDILAELVQDLHPQPVIIGIIGAPGSGKSVLANELVQRGNNATLVNGAELDSILKHAESPQTYVIDHVFDLGLDTAKLMVSLAESNAGNLFVFMCQSRLDFTQEVLAELSAVKWVKFSNGKLLPNF